MLECVINVSEGSDQKAIQKLIAACKPALLDFHSDEFHNRSVFTLAGKDVFHYAQQLAFVGVEILDITHHQGVHPRIGVVDVVPFVPLAGSNIQDAISARDNFAQWMSTELKIPCFIYGPERSLPEIRRLAFKQLKPDFGPTIPHASAGACAVGARPVLVAYNLWLSSDDIDQARKIAAAIRQPGLRTLGFNVGGRAQVSCNLLEPNQINPSQVYDLIVQYSSIQRAELVGLLPESVLESIPSTRWQQLDLSKDKTIEARLIKASQS